MYFQNVKKKLIFIKNANIKTFYVLIINLIIKMKMNFKVE